MLGIVIDRQEILGSRVQIQPHASPSIPDDRSFCAKISPMKRPGTTTCFYANFRSVVLTEKRPRAFLRILGCSKRTKNNHALFCEFWTVVSSVKRTCVFIGILDRSFHSERNHESKTMSFSHFVDLCAFQSDLISNFEMKSKK